MYNKVHVQGSHYRVKEWCSLEVHLALKYFLQKKKKNVIHPQICFDIIFNLAPQLFSLVPLSIHILYTCTCMYVDVYIHSIMTPAVALSIILIYTHT